MGISTEPSSCRVKEASQLEQDFKAEEDRQSSSTEYLIAERISKLLQQEHALLKAVDELNQRKAALEAEAILRQEPPGETHWHPNIERRGVLGAQVRKANHQAITVTDVAAALDFYVNVLGLQQIRRPDFDRYGAWLTAGNMEIHIIKGVPVIPTSDSLKIPHLSFDVEDIVECRRKLIEAGVHFTQNADVPSGVQCDFVMQLFLRDPDGYSIELCNCVVLADFCFNPKQGTKGLVCDDQAVPLSLVDVLQLLKRGEEARRLYFKRQGEAAEDLILPPDQQAREADPAKLAAMCQRTRVWGDLLQGETEASIAEALRQAGNSVPLATRILRANKKGEQVFVAPMVFQEGDFVGGCYQPRNVSLSFTDLGPKLSAADYERWTSLDARQRRLFEALDVDRDGAVSEQDVATFLAKCGNVRVNAEDVRKAFKMFDASNSGSLGFDEFRVACAALPARPSRQACRHVFALCDDDGSGLVQLPELLHKLSDLGVPMHDLELEELFIEADTEGRGKLTQETFINLLMGSDLNE